MFDAASAGGEQRWLLVHDGRRKLVDFQGRGERWLYDLASDPKEQSPSTEVPVSEPLVGELAAWFVRWEGERHRLVRRLRAEGRYPTP